VSSKCKILPPLPPQCIYREKEEDSLKFMSSLYEVVYPSVESMLELSHPPPSPSPSLFEIVTVNCSWREVGVVRVKGVDSIPAHLSNDDKHGDSSCSFRPKWAPL
jgi:hypothetical protein